MKIQKIVIEYLCEYTNDLIDKKLNSFFPKEYKVIHTTNYSNNMTEYEQTRINSIIEELSQYTLGGKPDGLSDFSIKPTLANEPNFYKNVIEVSSVLPLIFKPAETTKSNITQEGKHPTERIMRKTGHNILLSDGTVDFNRTFYDIGYLSRETFIIAMVYIGFNYVVRDREVYFRVKNNPQINKIINVMSAINKKCEQIAEYNSHIMKDTHGQLTTYYTKKISKNNDEIIKFTGKIDNLKK